MGNSSYDLPFRPSCNPRVFSILRRRPSAEPAPVVHGRSSGLSQCKSRPSSESSRTSLREARRTHPKSPAQRQPSTSAFPLINPLLCANGPFVEPTLKPSQRLGKHRRDRPQMSESHPQSRHAFIPERDIYWNDHLYWPYNHISGIHPLARVSQDASTSGPNGDHHDGPTCPKCNLRQATSRHVHSTHPPAEAIQDPPPQMMSICPACGVPVETETRPCGHVFQEHRCSSRSPTLVLDDSLSDASMEAVMGASQSEDPADYQLLYCNKHSCPGHPVAFVEDTMVVL